MNEAGTALTVTGFYQSDWKGVVMDTSSISIKPCVKCGAVDRAPSGYCRPCASDRRRKNYLKNKENELRQMKEWAVKNRERSRKIKQKWAKKNPDKMMQAIKMWNLANVERVKENRKRWNQENKDYKRTLTINRRRKLAEGKLSKDIVSQLMIRQSGLCVCCKRPLNGMYHIDHIMPIALGGTNTDDNVQLLLPKCNLEKSAKHPEVFMMGRQQNG